MTQKPEEDRMLRKNPETDVEKDVEKDVDYEKMTKAELVERLKKAPATSPDKDEADHVRDLEAQNAALQAELAKKEDRAKAGRALMDEAEEGNLPDYEMELAQFKRRYSYGGAPTPNPRVMAHRPFSVRGGEVFYAPKKLLYRLKKDHPDDILVGRESLKDQVIGSFEFDPKSGHRKPVKRTVPVEDLVAKAREVGLPSIR